MYIYKITNILNGMVYIGQCRRPYNKSKSYFGSGKKIIGEIYLHGKENFKKEILEECESVDLLDSRESYWIQYFDSANPKRGYNLRYGGHNSKFNDEFKKNMSNISSGENNPFFGKKHRADSIKKMSNSKLGDKNPNFGKSLDTEIKSKISNTLRGIKRNEITVSKMKSSALLREYKETECPHCGKIGKNNMKRYHFDNCKYNGKNNRAS